MANDGNNSDDESDSSNEECECWEHSTVTSDLNDTDESTDEQEHEIDVRIIERNSNWVYLLVRFFFCSKTSPTCCPNYQNLR